MRGPRPVAEDVGRIVQPPQSPKPVEGEGLRRRVGPKLVRTLDYKRPTTSVRLQASGYKRPKDLTSRVEYWSLLAFKARPGEDEGRYAVVPHRGAEEGEEDEGRLHEQPSTVPERRFDAIMPRMSTRLTASLFAAACLAACLAACVTPSSPGRTVQAFDGELAGDAVAAPDAQTDAAPDAIAAPDAQTDAAPDSIAAPDAPISGPPEVELSEAVYALDHLLEVQIDVEPASWEELRQQTRDRIDIRGAECLALPFPSPFTWFQAEVRIDGRRYPNVGLRKKGFFGSLSRSKPSLNIDLGRFGETATHESIDRFTLNNGRQDPSLLRTCLAYEVFRRAGVPAPRCHFAHVSVNGQALGVYAHVEAIRKPFLRRHFADDEGHLYEGTLSDFRPEFVGTFEQKTDEEAPYRLPLERIATAAQADDGHLLAALGEVVDLDALLTFWAAEVVTAHWDGYAGNTNNFWLYDDPSTGKVAFLPWGPDATFAPPRLLFEGTVAPSSVLATGLLTRRLYQHPVGRERYVEHLREVLDQAFSADDLLGRVETMSALILPRLSLEARAAHLEALGPLRTFIEEQTFAIHRELATGPVDWDVPLRRTLCLEPSGRVTGTFETTYGSWPTNNALETGMGTLQGSFDGDRFQATRVGAAIGFGQSGRVELVVPALLVDGRIIFIFLAFDAARLAPVALNIEDQVECSLNTFDADTGVVTRMGPCLDGHITFEAARRVAGSPVRGAFDVGLYSELE